MKRTLKHRNITHNSYWVDALIIIALCQPFPLAAQISLGGAPLSWSLPAEAQASVSEAAPPVSKIMAPILAGNEARDTIMQIAYSTTVKWEMGMGTWVEIPDIGRIWRLNIYSPGAEHISVRFDNMFLPKGSLLHLYNQTRSETLGAFSYHNNHTGGQLATSPISGDRITIEYFEPKEARGKGHFTIGRVSHGFVPISYAYEKTVIDCHVNVNCNPEGNNWQSVKKSIAMIVLDGAFVCTGTLMNNTFEDFTPYVLTARHCLLPGNYDAVTQPVIGDVVFYWNYATDGCTGSAPLSNATTSGAVVVANTSETGVAGSDFALLRLDENPADWYDVYFAGYETSATPATSGISLHHPGGQPLKIATYQTAPSSYLSNRFWRVFFAATPNGHSVTEGGSSGAPLIDANQRVIGQLYGGSSVNCSDPANDWSVYGKLAYSWYNNGAFDPRRRLSSWLDPQGNGLNTSLNGVSAEERPAKCAQLFFSEYVEAYSFQRCVEIYNPTEATINLAEGAYSLAFYFEGNTVAGSVIPLTGSIEPKGVYVVCDNDAGMQLSALANQTALPIFFNGDDAVALYKGNKVMDVIGQIGADPGSEWGSGYASTANNTIRRKPEIQQGDKNPSDAFNPADEWIGYPIGDFSGLGSHNCQCDLNTCVPGLLNYYPCGVPDVTLNIPPGATLLGPGVIETGFSPALAGTGTHGLLYIYNNDTCRISMVVADTIGPKINCRDFSIANIPETGYLLQAAELVDYAQSSDNCSNWEVSSFSPEVLLPEQQGSLVEVVVYATDAAGNAGQCTAKISLNFAYIDLAGTYGSEVTEAVLWPNPSTGIINVESKMAIKQLDVFDIAGNSIFHTGYIEAGSNTFDLSNLANGCYFAKIKFENESMQVVKVIVSRR